MKIMSQIQAISLGYIIDSAMLAILEKMIPAELNWPYTS